jgi:predicted nucleic acid-binding protein
MAAHVDTSIIVRYLIRDVPVLASQAAALIESDQELVISEVALAEAAHVLRTIYQVPRETLVDALVDLANRRNIRVRGISRERVIAVLRLSRPSGRVSIPDALILGAALEDGAECVHTFDRRFPAPGDASRSQ